MRNMGATYVGTDRKPREGNGTVQSLYLLTLIFKESECNVIVLSQLLPNH